MSTPTPSLSPAHLADAAQRFGTPLYVYDAAELDAAQERVLSAFGVGQPGGAKVFYAMKANPNLSLLRRFAAAGFGFECVSGGEIARAEHLGVPGERLLVNGPAKSEAEYAAGARLGATFIVDREEEVGLLPPRSRVLVRVNPALNVSTHDHLATGASRSKFGVTLEQAPHVLKLLREAGHDALGLHVHIGSAIRDAQDFSAAFSRLSELYALTGPLPVLDTGGGWGLGADLHGIAREARAAAQVFGAELWVEPGRYLVAQAGTLLTRVVGTKRTARNFCLVDAGMTELIRPMMYGAEHPITALKGNSDASAERWDIAGPACESGDLLARDMALSNPQRGDLLALGEAGAYGASMSSNYLSRPRPAEVLWLGLGTGLGLGQTDGQEWQVIRQREMPERIWAAELV